MTPAAHISEAGPLYGTFAASYGDMYDGEPQFIFNFVTDCSENPKSMTLTIGFSGSVILTIIF